MDLKQLEIDRQDAEHDKAELFEFYHQNWAALVEMAATLQDKVHENDNWQ